MVFAFAAAPPGFEVASVKPDPSETGVDRIKISKGDVIIQNVSLKRLISMAYGIPDSREYLLSGPDWLDSSAENATGPSVFTAIEEQLGLRLELRKMPLEVLVVDCANRVPAAN